VGIFHDITERLQAEQTLRQQREELSQVQRLATVGEFAASIAHEIHQPLTAILNNARAAQHFLSSDASAAIAEVRDALQDIIDDIRRAADVIHQLRSFLKKESGHYTIVDINTVIQKVITILHSQLIDKKIHVTQDLSPDIPHIKCNRIELQQVLLNLILNARDSLINVELQRRHVLIQTSMDGPESVIVAVQDSGTGLDTSEIDRVFESYYTTKPNGLGMGLSLSKSIIVGHGGRIWAANNAEDGATFYFTLPVQKG
jgi:C4-dicarboxylate-specific signal transduction histidine kinase